VLTRIAPGTIHATLPLSAPHINSKSILHGSVTATIIDWIGGLCVASASSNPLSANRGVSVDIHVSYTGGARLGEELLIVGSLDKLGKRMAFVRVEIRARKLGSEDEGGVVATGSHTKFVG
jgi:acyl-coenzyme A thioesterase 13